MATYEAFVTLGAASIAVSAIDLPLSVRTESLDIDAPRALLTLLMPNGAVAQGQVPSIRLIPLPGPAGATESDAHIKTGH